MGEGIQANVFIGIVINEKLQEMLDNCDPYNERFFRRKDPDYLQMTNSGDKKIIGKRLDKMVSITDIENIVANIMSILRKICPECKQEYTPSSETLKDIGLDEKVNIKFYKGKGCPACMNTGYKGRVGIYELLVPDEKMHNLIVAKAPAEEIRAHARSEGMISLADDGIQKIRDGLSTVEEVLRVTQEE